jgi:hypothetical protein
VATAVADAGNGHGQVIITYDPNLRQWGLPGDKLVPVEVEAIEPAFFRGAEKKRNGPREEMQRSSFR